MFEWFTERAIRVIMLAQQESRMAGHNYVGVEQVLLGLLAVDGGVAREALQSCGVTLESARAAVVAIVPAGTDLPGDEIPFTPRAKSALESAWREASNLHHNYIATEHLLLGLLHGTDGAAVRVLQDLGVDLTHLRNTVLLMLAEHSMARAAANPDEMHAQGSAGKLLLLLGRHSEASKYFDAALALPKGEHYKADADECKALLAKAGGA